MVASDIVIYIPDDGDPTPEQRSDLVVLEAVLEHEEVMQAARAAALKVLKHTVRGETSDEGWPYGTVHDYCCPACVASGSSYTSSPRSETYWAS